MMAARPATRWAALAACGRKVLADHRQISRYRAKYHQEKLSSWLLPVDAARKIGFQAMVMVRLMQLARDLRLPLGGQVMSRLIRHLYGCDIHWEAELEPGLSLIHALGLVVGHGARTEPGCILFQHVTLGEGIDPVTRQVGAPHLERDVHVGPGATVLGPITIGEGSKVMAGCTVAVSLPKRSRVAPAEVQVASRPAGGGRRAAPGGER